LIKAVTFDFWQTLYQPKPVDDIERLRQLKVDFERGDGTVFEQHLFEAAVKVARDTWTRAWVEEHRTMTANEWLAIVLQYLNRSLEAAHLLDIQTRMENSLLDRRPTLVPEAHDVLAWLSSRYRLAIISDTGLTPGRVLRQILEADQLTGYFAHLTFSDELGRSKPHPDAFLATLKALDARPEEAVHVGDLLRTDIAGAKNAGMRGVQYIGLSRDNGLTAGVTVTPDAINRHHAELEPLLQSWSHPQ
jgi:putative hydrolase of the HAD superfamily